MRPPYRPLARRVPSLVGARSFVGALSFVDVPSLVGAPYVAGILLVALVAPSAVVGQATSVLSLLPLQEQALQVLSLIHI